jgi:proteasome lid subunit RPN8/RPN11
MNFSHLYSEIKQHAIEAHPQECCGVIANNKYHRSVNRSSDPENSFKIAKQTMAAARKIGLQAIVHSHPDGIAAPSKADMEAQVENVVPWLLLTTDGEYASEPFMFGDTAPTPDLMKRTFRHGVTDCLSLIRDFYRSPEMRFQFCREHFDDAMLKVYQQQFPNKIQLNEFPREWDWWHHGEKMYEQHFEGAGFYKVDATDLRIGDLFFATIMNQAARKKNNTPNHGGIYVGNEMVLHHMTGAQAVESRLPKRDLACRYQNYISYWVRHEDA